MVVAVLTDSIERKFYSISVSSRGLSWLTFVRIGRPVTDVRPLNIALPRRLEFCVNVRKAHMANVVVSFVLNKN